MDYSIMIFAGVMLGMFIVFAALAVWLDGKRKARQRELEHIERLKAIECGYPLQEEESGRHKMVGGFGITTPIIAMMAATWTTEEILKFSDAQAPRWLLAVVWGVCGVVSLGVGLAAVFALRSQKSAWPAGAQSQTAGGAMPS